MTTITTLPPAPNRSDPSTFASKADSFVSALPVLVTEINTVVGEINTAANNASTKAGEALASANTATTQAGEALTSANNSASSAALAEDWATSLTEVTTGLYGARKYAQDAATVMSQYKGVLTTDPVSAVAGDWYVNSTSGFIRAYNGTSWVNGISAVAGVSSVNGQTGAVTVDQIDDTILSVVKTWSSAKIATDRQATLVSGTNIKTVNGTSVLGSGDVTVGSGGVGNNEVLSTHLIRTTASGLIATGIAAGAGTGLHPVVTIDSDRSLVMLSANGYLVAACHSRAAGWGATTLIRTGNFGQDGQGAIGRLIDTDKVLVVSCVPAATSFEAVVLTLVGTAITVNTSVPVTLPSAAGVFLGPPSLNPTGIVQVGASYVYGYNGGYLVAMTISGTTVTAAATATSVTGSPLTYPPLLYVTGSTLVVFGTQTDSSAITTSVAACTVSGTVITSGVAQALPSGGYCRTALLGGGRFSRVSSSASGVLQGCLISVSGTTCTVSAPVTLLTGTGTGTTICVCAPISATQVVVVDFYNSNIRYNVLTDNAGVAVAGTQQSLSSMASVVGDFGVRGGSVCVTYLQTTINPTLLRIGASGNNPAIVDSTPLFYSTGSYGYGAYTTTGDATVPHAYQLVGADLTVCSSLYPLALGVTDTSHSFVGINPENSTPLRESPKALWYHRQVSSTQVSVTRLEII